MQDDATAGKATAIQDSTASPAMAQHFLRAANNDPPETSSNETSSRLVPSDSLPRASFATAGKQSEIQVSTASLAMAQRLLQVQDESSNIASGESGDWSTSSLPVAGVFASAENCVKAGISTASLVRAHSLLHGDDHPTPCQNDTTVSKGSTDSASDYTSPVAHRICNGENPDAIGEEHLAFNTDAGLPLPKGSSSTAGDLKTISVPDMSVVRTRRRLQEEVSKPSQDNLSPPNRKVPRNNAIHCDSTSRYADHVPVECGENNLSENLHPYTTAPAVSAFKTPSVAKDIHHLHAQDQTLSATRESSLEDDSIDTEGHPTTPQRLGFQYTPPPNSQARIAVASTPYSLSDALTRNVRSPGEKTDSFNRHQVVAFDCHAGTNESVQDKEVPPRARGRHRSEALTWVNLVSLDRLGITARNEKDPSPSCSLDLSLKVTVAASSTIPETPVAPITTPHHQLVRWGSIRRATYGMTPISARQGCSPLEDEDVSLVKDVADCGRVALVQVVERKNDSSCTSNEVVSATPCNTISERKRAKVTMSADEHNQHLRKRKDSTNERSMTPVPINFRRGNDGSRVLFSASPDTESDQRSNSPRPKIRKDSLRDALRFGDMSCDPETCARDGVITVTLLVDSTNACQVRFDAQSGQPLGFVDSVYVQDTKVVGELSDVRKALTSHLGESSTLLTNRWILCHVRWIVWKLASYERRFSDFLAGRYLTYGNLISQLRRRFEFEIIEGHRPALRKILNRDAASTSLMILCVSQIITNGILADKEEDTSNCTEAHYKIELTDGWYSIQAVLDSKLSEFLRSGRVRVGTKLLISNAQLVGADEGVDPLDEDYDPASRQCQIGLRLSANATRLAKWNAKLGFVRPSTTCCRSSQGLLLVRRVSDILPGGGNIPCLQVTIAKRYPKVYYEKSGDSSGSGGTSSILSEAEEDARTMEFEKRTMLAAEKISESIEEELEKVGQFNSFFSRLCHRC